MKRLGTLLLSFLVLVSSGVSARADEPLAVTASFYPMYIVTLNITRDVEGVTVSCLAPPNAGHVHDYQMTTEDRRVLADSDIVIVNGAGVESFMEKLLGTLDAQVITATEGMDLLASDHGENAHVWVSVAGMIAEVEAIAAGLSAADPAHAAEYAANAEAYIARLNALAAEMKEALAPYADLPVVTFHEAFDYFAQEFGLRILTTVQTAHEAAPSGRRLAVLADLIRTEAVRALFAEPNYEDASVDILSRETGVPVYILDPVESGTLDSADYEAYERIMRENMKTIQEALG